jgi:hypothetical protein
VFACVCLCMRLCGLCVSVSVCVSNRQDVCRAEYSGIIAYDPNLFEPNSEVNILQHIQHEKIVVK